MPSGVNITLRNSSAHFIHKSFIMADSMCGPSNALQNFQKHSTVDRTLQQDRFISRQSPSQVYFTGSACAFIRTDVLVGLPFLSWSKCQPPRPRIRSLSSWTTTFRQWLPTTRFLTCSSELTATWSLGLGLRFSKTTNISPTSSVPPTTVWSANTTTAKRWRVASGICAATRSNAGEEYWTDA